MKVKKIMLDQFFKLVKPDNLKKSRIQIPSLYPILLVGWLVHLYGISTLL